MWLGASTGALGVVNVILDLLDRGSEPWEYGIHVGQLLLGVAVLWSAHAHRVEADRHGLVVHRVLWRSRVIPWGDVAELRPDAAHPWATRLVVVTTGNDVVDLPLEPTERGPAAAWRRHTGSPET